MLKEWPKLAANLECFFKTGGLATVRRIDLGAWSWAMRFHLIPCFQPWVGNKRRLLRCPLAVDRFAELICLMKNFQIGMRWCLGPVVPESRLPCWQLMLMQASSCDQTKVLWIDNGASSKRLVNCLGGFLCRIEFRFGLVFIPFHLKPGSAKPDGSKIKLILAVIEAMVVEEGKRMLRKIDRAKLEELIVGLYTNLRLSFRPWARVEKAFYFPRSRSHLPWSEFVSMDRRYGVWADCGWPDKRWPRSKIDHLRNKGFRSSAGPQNVLMLLITDIVRVDAASLKGSKKYSRHWWSMAHVSNASSYRLCDRQLSDVS